MNSFQRNISPVYITSANAVLKEPLEKISGSVCLHLLSFQDAGPKENDERKILSPLAVKI
ncbi:MAG TPA: hypothetical protein VGP47_01790 [Parachlamydiaceae bacterium]|nr:hypothetical protein [Parachlamydiaceae bacterium]